MHFHLPQKQSQLFLFLFLAALAIGTVAGAPFGRQNWPQESDLAFILGVLPKTLLLPYVSLRVTVALSILIGLIIRSAFSAILVYAQELVPNRVGMIAGLFFGLAFGMGRLGAAVLGTLADHTSIDFAYKVCAFLPALGLFTALLPGTNRPDKSRESKAAAELEVVLGMNNRPDPSQMLRPIVASLLGQQESV